MNQDESLKTMLEALEVAERETIRAISKPDAFVRTFIAAANQSGREHVTIAAMLDVADALKDDYFPTLDEKKRSAAVRTAVARIAEAGKILGKGENRGEYTIL